MKQSKFLKTVALALLLLWSRGNSQMPDADNQSAKSTVAEIPELQEWWRAPAEIKGLGRQISFLPNFYNGLDAIALQTATGPDTPRVHTWLNRFPGDTQNVFNWEIGFDDIIRTSILYGDFNGDGVRDYITPQGRIHRGIENGMPPEIKPSKKYSQGAIIGVYDFNKDGFDDICDSFYNVIYGDPDLENLQVVSFKGTFGINDTFREIYRTQSGEFRFIITSSGGYVLYRIDWAQGSTTPTVKKITGVFEASSSGDKLWIGFHLLYQSKHHDKTYLILKEGIGGDAIFTNIIIYDITNDAFEKALKFRLNATNAISKLQHSIDGDEYEDYYITAGGNGGRRVLFYKGGQTLDSVPFAQFSKTTECPFSAFDVVHTINDINGDGINDLVMGSSNNMEPNCLRFVLGPMPSAIQDEDNTASSFSFGETQPHPMKIGQEATVSVTISQTSTYTLSLYSIKGQIITSLFEGTLVPGKTHLPLNVPAAISSGTYILRLSDGTQSKEQTLILTQ